MIVGIQVPISEAKAKLADLVRRAEAGEDVALTRHGQIAAHLVPARAPERRERLLALFDVLKAQAALRPPPEVSAARSQDFLYDEETGLPA
jgi:prevent-host-death family protein